MKQQFDRVLDSARQNLPSSMELNIDGTVYTRNFLPRERLILLGGGHIAVPLCNFAAELGFSVTVVDDRPSFVNQSRFPRAESLICAAFPDAIRQLSICPGDYVAVITRGHRYDADCLRTILPDTMPRYLGMIGSKRRTVALLALLEEEGFDRGRLNEIHTPIGLDIGALTTKEIAISILAELIQCRRRDTNRRSKNSILTCEDIDIRLLEFIAADKTPKALLIVYETSGSTPVKSGAFMAVDENFRTVGTIGGGCGESAVLRGAYAIIGTGESQCVTVDMDNEIAAEEGMVCGGQLKVFMADLS